VTAKIIKTFRLHPDQIKRLERWAAKHEVQVSAAVEILLDKGMKYRPPKPKREKMPEVPRPVLTGPPTLGQIIRERLAESKAERERPEQDQGEKANGAPHVDLPLGPRPSPPGSRLKPPPKGKSKWALS
jgi:hypothetical protein